MPVGFPRNTLLDVAVLGTETRRWQYSTKGEEEVQQRGVATQSVEEGNGTLNAVRNSGGCEGEEGGGGEGEGGKRRKKGRKNGKRGKRRKTVSNDAVKNSKISRSYLLGSCPNCFARFSSLAIDFLPRIPPLLEKKGKRKIQSQKQFRRRKKRDVTHPQWLAAPACLSV
jgi:hypothetical protein